MNSAETLGNGAPIELVTVRDNDRLQTHSFLVPIREAIICVYDFMLEAERSGRNRRRSSLKLLKQYQRSSLCRLLGLTIDETNYVRNTKLLVEMYRLHMATFARCELACRGMKEFLEQRYPGQYEIKIYSTNYGLQYFMNHAVILMRDRDSGTYIGASVANMLNADFTLPRYRGQDFDRSITVIMATTERAIMDAITEIEGGCGWEDRSDWVPPQEAFVVKNGSPGKPRVVTMSDFIQQWENSEVWELE